MNKALTNLPYIIVSYWVLSCFLFYFQNSWFFDNYFLLNRIDDCIWAIMMLHLMFSHSLYNKTKKVLITTTVAIALCQELQYHLSKSVYFEVYCGVLVFGILCAVFINLNANIEE